MLRWCGDDDMNLASPSECFEDLYRLIASETHVRLTGTSFPIDPMQRRGIYDHICGNRGSFPAAAAMVMSCCCWLAVG
jgi:hypothetical protein